MAFSILDHLDKLESDGGSYNKRTEVGSFYCPACGSKNFKPDKNGGYGTYGCKCAESEEGKRAIREAVSPSKWVKPDRPKQERQWEYCDADGNALVIVHRKDLGGSDREFRQSRADGRGEPRDVLHLVMPYRYQDCLDAIAKGEQVFWVEGEACCDALWGIGLAATTTIGGCKRYRSEQYRDLFPFPGDALVICPDRDKLGMEYAEAIAADYPQAKWLYAPPNDYYWRNLPDSKGADVADWILGDKATREMVLGAVCDRREFAAPTPAPTAINGEGSSPAQTVDDESPRWWREYRALESQIGDRIAYNEMTGKVELDGKQFDLDGAKVRLATKHGIVLRSGKDEVAEWLLCMAEENSYNPVKRYLEGLPADAPTAILDDLAWRYFGQKDPIYQTLIRKTLLGAIARVMQPGCYVDGVAVLQGKKKLGKTRFWTILGGEYFSNGMKGSHTDKDEQIKLRHCWLMEWGELAFLQKRTIESIKDFITSTFDELRKPYGRETEKFPRHSLIVGTTNETDFLVERENRRFWVIPVMRKIDQEMLARERDAIWAAAMAAYRNGETWLLSDEEAHQVNEIGEAFKEQDPWDVPISDHVFRLERNAEATGQQEVFVTTGDLLEKVIGQAVDRQDRRGQLRTAKILQELGYERRKKRVDGRQVKGYGKTMTTVVPMSVPMSDYGTTTVPTTVPPESLTQQDLQTSGTDGTVVESKKPEKKSSPSETHWNGRSHSSEKNSYSFGENYGTNGTSSQNSDRESVSTGTVVVPKSVPMSSDYGTTQKIGTTTVAEAHIRNLRRILNEETDPTIRETRLRTEMTLAHHDGSESEVRRLWSLAIASPVQTSLPIPQEVRQVVGDRANDVAM